MDSYSTICNNGHQRFAWDFPHFPENTISHHLFPILINHFMMVLINLFMMVPDQQFHAQRILVWGCLLQFSSIISSTFFKHVTGMEFADKFICNAERKMSELNIGGNSKDQDEIFTSQTVDNFKKSQHEYVFQGTIYQSRPSISKPVSPSHHSKCHWDKACPANYICYKEFWWASWAKHAIITRMVVTSTSLWSNWMAMELFSAPSSIQSITTYSERTFSIPSSSWTTKEYSS